MIDVSTIRTGIFCRLCSIALLCSVAASISGCSEPERSQAEISTTTSPGTGRGRAAESAQAVDQPESRPVTVNEYLQRAHSKGLTANRLIGESSPYLLQHAYNPVDWYPWGEAAFEAARKENKPIFLSIGYSTCHWCHVMAHESFENSKIADYLNQHFVAIKVDREQRPDIDNVYMLATQVISGHGGWPMTVFLDHQLRPFHAATYYPPFGEGERKGLYEVLTTIEALWQQQHEKLDAVASTVTARITALADDTAKAGQLDADIYQRALQQISGHFDEESGGFSAAPKFPQPGIFAFLNGVAATGDDAAQSMMKLTLDAMASGGMYDQLAGGFHRYSVDAEWQVPHFEKMLYNQSLMLIAYSDYYRIEPLTRYKQVVYQTLGFLRDEMRSPRGGYYSALDADSPSLATRGEDEGKRPGFAEGAYYLWRQSEIETLLYDEEFAFIQRYFGLQPEGNIHSDPYGEFAGLNILSIDEGFRHQVLDAEQSKWLASASKKMAAERLHRPRPQLDDKMITAWNGMLISAFAQASMTFDDPVLATEAELIAQYVKRYLYHEKTTRLFRHHRGSAAKGTGEALLVDYVWMINGLLQLYQASRDRSWLDWAEALSRQQDELFLDIASGAYFESTDSDTSILFRSRSIADGALPSANAIALSNLYRLAALEQDADAKNAYEAKSKHLVRSFSSLVNEQPMAASMLLAVEFEASQDGMTGEARR